MTFLAIDRSCMEDLLFWQSLSRSLAARPANPDPIAIVHALGEHTERILESGGVDVERQLGLIRTRQADSDLLRRAAREEGRRIANALTEGGISAVSFMGSDRGLSAVQDGVPAFRATAWLRTLADSGAVPLISAYMDLEDGLGTEWNLLQGIAGFCRQGDQVVILSSREPLKKGKSVLSPASPEIRDTEGVLGLIRAGVSVRISGVSGLAAGAGNAGVAIVAE